MLAAGPLAGKSLVATHIDSWEVGSQNWTPKFREEFQKRRGYDPLPWLPCVTDSVRRKVNGKTTARSRTDFDSVEMANRFRWDFEQTISELLAENYSGRLAELAHEHGLRYSLEGYNLPFGDEFTYTARADEPMTEFWTRTKFGQNETIAKPGRWLRSRTFTATPLSARKRSLPATRKNGTDAGRHQGAR